jgi:hypothetical protein
MIKYTPDEVIMYSSLKAAQIVTVTGWMNRHGTFYGDDEHLARWSGSTHKYCEGCDAVIEMRGYCEPCHQKHVREEWLKFPLVEWDGTGMFCTHDSDKFFSSTEEFYEWCAEDDINPEDVMLVVAEAHGLSTIDSDHWCDELAEDHEPPLEVLEALEALNKVIRAAKPQTYWPSKKRMILKREVVSSEDADVSNT